MNQEDLRQSLERLQLELQNVDHPDPESRELLLRLRDEIEDVLQSEEGQPDGEGLSDSLRAQMGRFEATHPELTAIMQRVINALTNIGL